jgi:hypothetical protein
VHAAGPCPSHGPALALPELQLEAHTRRERNVRHSGGKGRDEGRRGQRHQHHGPGLGCGYGGVGASALPLSWRKVREPSNHGMARRHCPEGRGGHGATRSTTPVLRNGKSDGASAKEDPAGAKQCKCKQMGRRRRAAIRPGHD